MWADTKYGVQAFNSTFESESTEVLTCQFQVKNLPVIKSEVEEVDSVLCTSSHLYLIAALNKKISIFSEESSEIFWEIETRNKVCCISLSNDSCLLLVAEFSGEIRLIHIASKTSMWNYTCRNEEMSAVIKEVFITIDSAGLLKLLIFANQEIVYEFSNISVSALYNAVESQNHLNLFEDIQMKKFTLFEMFPNYEIKSIFRLFCNSSLVGLGVSTDADAVSLDVDYYFEDDMIHDFPEADWEIHADENRIFQCFDFSAHGNAIKAVCAKDGRYIIFLNENHVLNIMCPFTSAILKTWNDKNKSHIKNFVLKESIEPSSLLISDRKIGLLIAPISTDSGYFFEIRSFPTFDLIFSLNLSNYAEIGDCNLNQEFWCLIDGKMNFNNSGQMCFNYLSMKEICEASPEARLMSLINRRKFLEAQKFAEISNMNSEVIYRTKINCFLNNLSMNKYKNSSQAEMDKIWNEFNKSLMHLTDVSFVQSILLHSLPDAGSMKKVLFCIKNWVISHGDIQGSEKIISKVNQILCKLTTYEIICTSDHSSLTLNNFLNKDLLNNLILEFKNGDFNIACLIWQRHKDDVLMSLNEEVIEQILTAIPDSLSSCHLNPFLYEDFLPFLFIKFPSCIDMVAEWLTQRIYLIEFSEKDLWPENGMSLVTGFLTMIKSFHEKEKVQTSFSLNLSISSIHKKIAGTDNPVGCLVEFSKDLVWLTKLKSQFNCKVSLSDFQISKTNVMFAVLDYVHISQIANIIDNFARPYALEHELELDFCLLQYIEKTFQTSCFTWWCWDAKPWEERLIAVTESIHATNRWVNAALMIVGRSSIPWSEGVKKLVQKGIECDYESKEFQIQAKLVGLKEVLLKYEMQDFPINNDVNLIHVLVNFIFKQNKAEVLEDVKKVLTSVSFQYHDSDIYYKYLQFTLNQNKIDLMMEVFASLSVNTAVACAKRLLGYIKLFLDNRFLVEEQKEHIANMLYTGLYLLGFLKQKKESFFEELQIPFRSLLKLQEEFEISMTFTEISCKSRCQSVLETAIADFLNNRRLLKKVTDFSNRKQVPAYSIFKLYSLGDILLFEREQVMGFLITNCLQEQEYDLVLQLCKELTESFPSSNITHVLMQVVDHFYLNFRSIKNVNFEAMVNTIFHLNSVAVTYCKEDCLEKWMNIVHLSAFLNSLKKISGQQHMAIFPEYTMDFYHKWRFYPFYSDEGFQLDCENIIDFVILAYGEFVKQPNDTLVEIGFTENDVVLKSMKELMQHMSDRGQGMAAFRILFYYFHMKSKMAIPTSDCNEIYSAIFQDFCSITYTIVQRILGQRGGDLYYAYSLLSVLPESSQFLSLKSLIKWCSNDLNRLATVSRIGVEVAKSLQKSDYLSMYENIYKKASLLSRRNARSVPMEIILQSSSSESNWPVVKDLVLTQEIDLPTVYECCSAFQLPTDHVLTTYLKYILVESEKKYLSGNSTDVEIKKTFEKAAVVINCIAEEELLYNNLKSLMKKISPYSYEFLLFIETTLHSLSASIQTINTGSAEKNRKLLKFLQLYERISPVTPKEVNRWSALYPTNPKLPLIASTRLPFHFLSQEDPFSIINPELSVDTLDVWLKIAPVLKVTEDHLIIISVKNTVLKYLKQQFSFHFILDPDMKFVDMIDKMISKVKELESSVACASWVANQMPAGGNKVEFASMAVDYSQQWYEQSPSCVLDVYNKLVSFKQQSAVERVLHKNNLASEEILSMKHSPSQLIEHLIEEFSFDIDKCIKGCKAISEIGDIVEINLIQVLVKFIFKWLNVTKGNTATNNVDELFLPLSPVNKEFEEDDTDDTNLLRIINLLLSLPQSLFDNLSQVMQDNLKIMPLNQRTRLLFCFVSVFDVPTVAKFLEWDVKVLDENLIPLLCNVELENLNLPYSFQTFHKCNKTELVQRILSISYHKSKAVIFCVKLCLEYNIWDTATWEVILRRMIVKDGKDYPLQVILQSVQGNLVHLWHSETFKDAWKCALSKILRKLEDSPVLVSELYKAILSCPCISLMDIDFFTCELSCVMQTGMTKMVPITDVSSLVLNLREIMMHHSQHDDH